MASEGDAHRRRLEETDHLMLEQAMAALLVHMWPVFGMTTYRLYGFGCC